MGAKRNGPVGTGSVPESRTATTPLDCSDSPTAQGFWPTDLDISAFTPRELEIHLAGVMHGVLATHSLRDARDEAHAAALHRRAYETVQAIASVPERDAEADAERAARRADWWAERRGERRPA